MNFFKLSKSIRHVLCLAVLFAFSWATANAQVEVIMDLESGTTGWTTSGHFTTTSQACAGTSWRDNLYGSSTYGYVQSPNSAAISNGTDVTVDFDYKVVDWSAATVATTGDWGSVIVDYSIDNGVSWDTLTTIDMSNHVVSNVCATISNTIPAASIPAGSDFMVRFAGNYGTAGDYYLYFDNISCKQVPTSAPNCTNVHTPANGATGVSTTVDLLWSDSLGLTDGYYVNVGTTSGGTDVVNNFDNGLSTTYALSGLLTNTVYYATILPYNTAATAAGCTEISFTTVAVPPVCTTLDSPADGAVDVNENADMTWSAPAGVPATGYKLILGTTPGGTDVLDNVDVGNVLTYDQGTMAYNTTHYATVIPYNANGDATGCDTTSFTTRLDPTVTAPVSEDFSAGALPTNWVLSGGENWLFGGPAGWGAAGVLDHTDGVGTEFAWVDGSSTAYPDVTMEMAPIDISGLTTPALQFYLFSNNADNPGDNAILYVQASGDNGATWTTELTYSADAPDWVYQVVDLSGYIGGSVRIRFVTDMTQMVNDAFYNDILVDDIVVDELPCVPPSSLVATSITQTTADISWSQFGTCATGGEYWIETQDTLAPGVSGTAYACAPTFPISLTTLTSETTYYVWGTEFCATDSSDVVVIGSFTTLPYAPLCPLSYDTPFDGQTDVATSTVFEWTEDPAGGSGSSFDVYLGQSHPDSMVFIGNIGGPFLITGLEFDSTYYWYVVPINVIDTAVGCDAGFVSFTVTGLPDGPDTIACDPPYSPGDAFADDLDTQGGWTGDIGTGTTVGDWNFNSSTGSSNTGATSPFSGTNFVYYEASTSIDTARMVSPMIDLATGAYQAAELSFYMHASGAGIGHFEVGVATDPAGPFTPVFNWSGYIQTTQAGAWHQVGVDMTSYINDTVYIQLQHVGVGNFEGDMCIDAMKIEACVDCVAPSDLVGTLICPDGAELSWTNNGTASMWDIYEATAASPAPDGTTTPTYDDVTSNPFNPDDPLVDTYYWVRSDCGDGFVSPWIGPVVIGPATVETTPYTTGFDVAPTGWNMTGWFTTGTNGNPGARLTENTYSATTMGTATTAIYGPVATGQDLFFDARVLNWSGYPNAGAPGTGYGDITVEISTDCGQTFSVLDVLGDTLLADSATHWHSFMYDMAAYEGMNVAFRFSTNWLGGDWFADLDNFALAAFCDGTPTPGTATASSAAVCSGADFDLTLTGASADIGNTYQWEVSSDDATWTSLTGATATTATTNQTADMYYRAVTTCESSGLTAASNSVLVTIETDECICPACDSYSTSSADTKIDTIVLGSMTFGSDPSNCESYTQYCDSGLELAIGDVVPLSIVNGSCSGNHYGAFAGAYADWNGDGDYDDADEVLFATTAATTALGTVPDTSFVVPAHAIANEKVVIRIIMRESSATTGCGTYSYGETEDIEALILPEPMCDLPLTGVTALVLDSTRAAVAWDASPTAGFFKIQYRELGASSWNPIINVKNRDYQRVAWILPGLTPNTTYQYRVRQQCEDLSAGPYSTIQTFTTFTTSPCEIPNDSKIVYLQDADKVRVFLDYEPTAERYDIRWKLAGTTVVLDNKITKKSSTVLDGLSPSTDYEYRVRTKCSGVWTGYSAWKAFSTHGIGAPLAPPASSRGDYSASTHLAVYPNPVDQTLFVEFEGTGEKHIRMMDVSGRLVLDQIVQDQLEILDVARFPQGTYFMQVIFDNGDVVTQKVVKQ